MEWDEYSIYSKEYPQYFRDVVREKLPKAFLAMYDKNASFHDLYLNSFYIANTGPLIHALSKKGGSTLQLDLLSHDHWENILVIYQNVRDLRVDLHPSDEVNRGSPTGFGRCYSDTFTIQDDGTISHEYLFEGGSTIMVTFERISFKKVVNTYWR